MTKEKKRFWWSMFMLLILAVGIGGIMVSVVTHDSEGKLSSEITTLMGGVLVLWTRVDDLEKKLRGGGDQGT